MKTQEDWDETHHRPTHSPLPRDLAVGTSGTDASMGKPRADDQIHDTWNKPHVGLGAVHAQDTQQRSTKVEGGLGKTYEGHECHCSQTENLGNNWGGRRCRQQRLIQQCHCKGTRTPEGAPPYTWGFSRKHKHNHSSETARH